jgi:chemotaxis protein methyltransferase CheR
MAARPQIDRRYLDRFRDIIASRFGLRFDEDKLTLLSEVLRRRLADTDLAPATYLTVMESPVVGREEGRLVIGELTVAETYFFRNVEQFNACRDAVVRGDAQGLSSRRALRILSAGCASGEEAYSLAILLSGLPASSDRQVSIQAIDVNPAVLERAARGRYSTWSRRATPPDVQARYFRTEGRDVVLDPGVLQMVSFEERNLSEEDRSFWRAEAFDVIFCRNVLMYFESEAAASVVGRMVRSLTPGGLLFMGHAETLRGLSHDFHLRNAHGAFYYQRKTDLELSDADGGERPLERMQRAQPADDGPTPGEAVAAAAQPYLPVAGDPSWAEVIRRASERIRSLTSTSEGPSIAGRPEPGPGTVAAGTMAPRAPAFDLGPASELLRQERFSEATDALTSLPAESEGDPDALLLRAVLMTHGGDLAAAEQLCDQVLRVDELNAGAHYLAALCRESAGDRRGAVDHHQRAIYLDAAFAMPRLHLGLLARRAGNHESARRELIEALALLQREDASRLLLFAGGFSRDALSALCRSELRACGGAP